jgi:type I restriction enzyme, S subunit
VTNRAWTPYITGELVDDGHLIIADGYRAKNAELGEQGLPFARAGNIDQGFEFDDADLLADENLDRAGYKVSEPGDVVFTSKGTVGRFAFVRAETARFVYSPQLCFWRVRNKDLIHPHFLYFWMHGREFLDQLEALKAQTDMADYVSLRDQKEMDITLPPLSEQQAVVAMLAPFDDRITLNRQMNRTLARTLELLIPETVQPPDT